VMRAKVHWKLTAIFCVLVCILLVIIYSYLKSYFTSYVLVNYQKNLQKEMFLIKDYYESQITVSSSIDDIDTLTDSVGERLGVRVTVVNNKGIVLGDSELSGQMLRDVENHYKRSEIQDAINKGIGKRTRYSATLRKHMLYLAVPISIKYGHDTVKEETQWILRLAVPVTDIIYVERSIRNTIIIAMVGVFLIAVLIGYGMSVYISRPLVEMAAIARNMGEGDFTKKIFVKTNDEIGDLADSLNSMAGKIKSHIDKITYDEARLQAVLSSMSEGVMVSDEKGNIMLMNPSIQKLFLVDQPCEGKRPIEIIRNPAIQDIVDNVLRRKSRLTEEIFIHLPEEMVLQINGVPIMRNAHCEGAILVFHNITELKKLENVRKDFVANVSHELRTPIASIKGYAETLLDGALEDKNNAREFVEIIDDDSNRLAKLIDDLLELSSIESDKMKLNLYPLDFAFLVKKVSAILKNQIREKELNLKLKIPDNLPKLLADEVKLSQVILNLLDNAIKYTPRGAVITVSTIVQERFLRIDIADTGIGIPEQDLPRIFERFYRADKAHSRELAGTGLGLSIVKHIVQIHGGEICATSEIGKGTIFSFTIPKA